MRLGLTSWNPFERLLIATGWLPTPLLLGYWGMLSGRCLIAAVELGVFDALVSGPLPAEAVAERIDCDPVGTEALLNALNGFGYVRRRHDTYSNRRVARRWLQRGARFQQAEAFGLFHVLWDELDDLEDRLRSSESRDFHRPERDGAFWERYERALATFANLTAAEIVRRVRLAGTPKRLLDVGGGHGAYSMAFCRRYPDLHAEVIDLPGAARVGRGLVASAGLADRVTYREGDLLGDAWGEDFDVVLVFNVVHTLPPERVAEVFGRARSALRTGGTLVVADSEHRGGTGDLDTAGGANELLFYVINNTRAYPESAVAGWMRQAGFSAVRTRHLLTVPQAALTTGLAS